MRFIPSIIVVLFMVAFLYAGSSDAASGRKKGRKNKGADQCHQKEIMKCFDKLTSIGKESDPTSIIASSSGLNRICKNIKDDSMKCLKQFFKKCGTPLHREISDLVMDMVTYRVKQFCDDSQQKSRFLKHSPCFHSKVLKTEEFKAQCNAPFLNMVGKIDMNHIKADDAHESICCGFNTWYECSQTSVKSQCTSDGARVFRDFHNATLGPVTDLLCPPDVFSHSSSSCKKLASAAKPNKSGKKPENLISKLVINMAPFLFGN